LQLVLHFSSFLEINNSFHGDATMHKILAAAVVLGFLGLPIFASAQSTNQPSTKKETAGSPGTSTKKAAESNATRKAANKGSMKRQATKKKRLAMHGHKMGYATAKQRFAKSPSRHRHASGFSTAKKMHRASATARTTNARGQTSIQRKTAYRAGAPTQRNCGEFMYWKDGKCNDARNKKPAK
jgi:hypothetical protein